MRQRKLDRKQLGLMFAARDFSPGEKSHEITPLAPPAAAAVERGGGGGLHNLPSLN
jgi:hypothetical protein